uniref:Uncharacterized protein n=1 Tax=Rhizophora mucronata TaxID=61149 RepID=A0A2P2NUU9_RHIMU
MLSKSGLLLGGMLPNDLKPMVGFGDGGESLKVRSVDVGGTLV